MRLNHEPAGAFLHRSAAATELFCLGWPTLRSYLRITTHPRIFANPLTPGNGTRQRRLLRRHRFQEVLGGPRRTVPLGEREGQTLEFKGRGALGDLWKLGREVVAFLNSEGGTLWIGLREENGVAVGVEGLQDAASEKGRLLDSLVDSIEPPLRINTLSIEVVATDDGNQVLRADVRPAGSRTVYHLKKGRGRFVFERIHHLTWDEIAGRVGPRTREHQADAIQGARKRILEERGEFLAKGVQALWLRILPTRGLNVDLRSEKIRSLVTKPSASDNRAGGWNPINPYAEPIYRPGRLEQQGASIQRDGSLTLELPLSAFHWRGDDDELYPCALAEYPVSMFRIARALYRDRLFEGDLPADPPQRARCARVASPHDATACLGRRATPIMTR